MASPSPLLPSPLLACHSFEITDLPHNSVLQCGRPGIRSLNEDSGLRELRSITRVIQQSLGYFSMRQRLFLVNFVVAREIVPWRHGEGDVLT